MKKNVGGADRIVRIVIGILIIGGGIAFKNPLGLIGIIPLATGSISWCPLYLPFGLSTKKKD